MKRECKRLLLREGGYSPVVAPGVRTCFVIATAIKAVYEDGVFKPKEPVTLEGHTEVEVLVPAPTRPQDTDDPTGWEAIDSLIGCLHSRVSDGAEHHDTRVYGDPRS